MLFVNSQCRPDMLIQEFLHNHFLSQINKEEARKKNAQMESEGFESMGNTSGDHELE